MKDLYSIGETAKLMGISVQTLRYYSKIRLLNPRYTDPDTGYRYYAEDQFHFIDRIKYLQKFGLNLTDIDRILTDGRVETLLPYLEKQKDHFTSEAQAAQETADNIQWYINYFNYIGHDSYPDVPYKLFLDKRYIVSAPCKTGEPSEDYHIRLNKIKNGGKFKALKYKRQFSYVIDFDSMIKKQLHPFYLGMFLDRKPSFSSEHILEIPAGEYLCFRGRILTDEWNPDIASEFFKNRPKPQLVLANEFENSLVEYKYCMYEIQILIS